jgi:hypothetical protein
MNYNNLFILIILIVVIFYVYNYFTGKSLLSKIITFINSEGQQVESPAVQPTVHSNEKLVEQLKKIISESVELELKKIIAETKPPVKPTPETSVVDENLSKEHKDHNKHNKQIVEEYLKPICTTCTEKPPVNKLLNSNSEAHLPFVFDSFATTKNPETFDNLDVEINDFDSEYYNYNKKENFVSTITSFGTKTDSLGFPKIKSNKLYYGLECNYVKDDSFYNALKQEGFILTSDASKASLIVPCSYESTENEIEKLEPMLKNNIYGNAVRVFMLNNTDFMVSKIALWKFLKDRYGDKIASTMIPKSVDLTNKAELDEFVKSYDKNKLFITKNNNQRQEGLEIHSTLDSILKSSSKYILVQELLQNPYLISGRKINLRVYCLIIKDTNQNTNIQIYQDGFMYYTPELFEKGNPSFKKNITTGYIDRKVYEVNPLTHEDFKKYLDNPNRKRTQIEEYFVESRPNIKLSTYVFTQINHLLKFILETYVSVVGSKTLGVGFQLYGADIAIDEHLRPMIMEINKGPDLTAKDGRDKQLKESMCKDILKSVGLVTPNTNNKFLSVLEITNINNELVEFDNYSSE